MKIFLLISAAALVLMGGKFLGRGRGGVSAKKIDPSVAFKNVEAGEAEALLKGDKSIVVLDVRTPKEHAAGRIAGAKNVDFYADDFEAKIAALDKTRPYLVHCAVGGRSAKARDLMRTMPFKMIYHLEGGMKAWEKAGKPVER